MRCNIQALVPSTHSPCSRAYRSEGARSGKSSSEHPTWMSSVSPIWRTAEIRDQRLYRATFETFEAYCRER